MLDAASLVCFQASAFLADLTLRQAQCCLFDLQQILLSASGQRQIRQFATGRQCRYASRILSKINRSSLAIPLPPAKAEEEAIATIMSNMDAEIAVLEEKLAKAHQLKQGMMQELLTGKTRLVENGK